MGARVIGREADVLAQLSHPNIVTLYDRGEVDGRLWISMEYVAGTDAAEMVAKRGPLDRELVLALVGGAGAALDHAWSKHRVTHRDVKPANILVGLDESDGDARIESVKLADFGIAKAAGEATSLTATGLTVGTMQYTSPEAIEGRELNNRADVYSLGCTAFHLLTGRPPYSGSSITALLSAHLHQAPPRVNDVVPQFAPSVDAVFAKVLAKDPALRYASCGEFVDDLARALDGGAGPAFDRTLTAASMPPGDVARGGSGCGRGRGTRRVHRAGRWFAGDRRRTSDVVAAYARHANRHGAGDVDHGCCGTGRHVDAGGDAAGDDDGRRGAVRGQALWAGRVRCDVGRRHAAVQRAGRRVGGHDA